MSNKLYVGLSKEVKLPEGGFLFIDDEGTGNTRLEAAQDFRPAQARVQPAQGYRLPESPRDRGRFLYGLSPRRKHAHGEKRKTHLAQSPASFKEPRQDQRRRGSERDDRGHSRFSRPSRCFLRGEAFHVQSEVSKLRTYKPRGTGKVRRTGSRAPPDSAIQTAVGHPELRVLRAGCTCELDRGRPADRRSEHARGAFSPSKAKHALGSREGGKRRNRRGC